MAFSPGYASNHLFYVSYTDLNGDSRVAVYHSVGGVGDSSSGHIILAVHQPYANHNGGQLQFDKRGYLYFGLGDGGSHGDPQQHAQSMGSRLGKLLRSSSKTPNGQWKIVGLGLRNPWRFSFDSLTNDLWIGDVGQATWEEVDFRAAAKLDRLANYGWSRYEGYSVFDASHKYTNRGDKKSPLLVYDHSNGKCAITGGYVYRGSAVPSAQGRYFYGDYCTGAIESVTAGSSPVDSGNVPHLSSFGTDGHGELFALSLDGALYELTAGSGTAAAVSSASADWTRFGYAASRSSDDPNSTGWTATNIASAVRTQVQLPGTVDASAIYLKGVTVHGAPHDTLFVTTTYGITLAIDARSGAILWQWKPPSYSSYAGTSQITTATPVADPSRQWIYASSPDGKIQKLSVATGHVRWRVSITKDPTHEKITSPLNYANGHVIATTGGYIGDAPPYQGHVAIVSTRGRLLYVWNSLCSNRHGLINPPSCGTSDSAIWGRSGAVVVPGSGNLLVATGNGPWDGKTNWGDAVLELSPKARMLGNYTPTNTQQLNESDTDIGSTSPVYLTKKLIAQGGKDGNIRLLSLARMHGTAAHKGHEVQIVSTPSGSMLFTDPAVWRANGHVWMFEADGGATQAWILRSGRLHPVWRHDTGGTSPVLAGGLLYVFDPGGGLNVYKPANGKLVTTLDAGGGHWNSPIATDGLIVLPEGDANDHATSGALDIWH
jgi:hypothetical protein